MKENGDVLTEGSFQIKGRTEQNGIKVSRPELLNSMSVKGSGDVPWANSIIRRQFFFFLSVKGFDHIIYTSIPRLNSTTINVFEMYFPL